MEYDVKNMTEDEIRIARRKAFKKKERVMRKGIMDAMGMLMGIPDETGKIGEVGSHLAEIIAKENAIVIPYRKKYDDDAEEEK